jgi:hypothetical protein
MTELRNAADNDRLSKHGAVHLNGEKNEQSPNASDSFRVPVQKQFCRQNLDARRDEPDVARVLAIAAEPPMSTSLDRGRMLSLRR